MRRIWLSINIAEDAVADENKLEALAFSMLIKTKFVSSVFKDATVRRCNKVFGMGSTRSNRLINNGLKYGYLMRSGNDIIATKIFYQISNCHQCSELIFAQFSPDQKLIPF